MHRLEIKGNDFRTIVFILVDKMFSPTELNGIDSILPTQNFI